MAGTAKKECFIEVNALYREGKIEPMVINSSSISYLRRWYPSKGNKESTEGTVFYLKGKDKYIIAADKYDEIKAQLS